MSTENFLEHLSAIKNEKYVVSAYSVLDIGAWAVNITGINGVYQAKIMLEINTSEDKVLPLLVFGKSEYKTAIEALISTIMEGTSLFGENIITVSSLIEDDSIVGIINLADLYDVYKQHKFDFDKYDLESLIHKVEIPTISEHELNGAVLH